MLLKEMNFRDIVDKYLYIDAAGVAQNLGSRRCYRRALLWLYR